MAMSGAVRGSDAPAEKVDAIAARAGAAPPPARPPDRAPPGRGELSWFVVYTNVNCEVRARKGLEALGYVTFLPTLRRFIRHARQCRAVDRPLFTRYLFVGLDPARDGWYEIRSTHGVESVLGHAGTPEPVPASVVGELMAAQQAGRFDLTQPPARFRSGERVAIEGGAFGAFVAEVVAADDGKRVEILHRMFGRLTRMRIDVARVRRRDNDDVSRAS